MTRRRGPLPSPAPGALAPRPAREIARRTFLAGLGLGAAGLLVAGGVSATPGGDVHARREGRAPISVRRVPAFEHVVVLMLENRSYDHLLGWLYRDDQLRPGQRVEGLYQHPASNRAPDGSMVAAYRYSGSRDAVLVQPRTNAGEDLGHVDRQLFGDVPVAGRPTMTGFVTDYVENFRALRGREPRPDEYRQVMGGFTPDALPVLTTLARSFGVFDHWFAAVPSETFCNRSFFHAATSHGFVTNAGGGGYGKWWDAPAVPTIFNRLEDAGRRWRVYYDQTQAVSLTGILAAPSVERYWKTDFRSMEQFHADARGGRLPAYSFIEPRMIFNRNSMHPPTVAAAPRITHGGSAYDKGIADVLAAESLVAEVYESIRTGDASGGSNPSNTTLIVTFDESGGLFDHVPPPSARPPDDSGPAGELGFTFDRLGGRVPAIVVSSWIDPGTVVNDRVDHTSVIATLCAQHGLPSLTDRDAASRPLLGAVTRSTPRPVSTWPVLRAPTVPVPPAPGRAGGHPPTATSLGIVGLVLDRFAPHAPRPVDLPSVSDTLADHGAGLFGTRDPVRPGLATGAPGGSEM